MAEFIMLTGDCEKGKTFSLHFVHEILVTHEVSTLHLA